MKSSFYLALSVLVLGLGCRSEPSAEARKAPAPAADTTLTVFAAASLREAFQSMARDFEKSRPGAHVTFNFAGTQQLRTQLEHGATVDVFAAADTQNVDALAQQGLLEKSVIFAHNEPVLVVSRESAASVKGLADVSRASRVVLGAPEVPIGRYTLQILDRANALFGSDFKERVLAKVVSRELNVRQVLSKVELGEADVGFVYRSDTSVAKGQVTVVSLPAEVNVLARYPIALSRGAAHRELGLAFIGWVTSREGRRVLEEGGFTLPGVDGG
jgi:molybdate transport system substrate-binding protein